MLHKKIKLIFLIVALMGAAVSAQVSKTGTTAAKFLNISLGPRANAMGGAFSAVADDASSMYWNAAGISKIKDYQGIFSYTKLFADVKVNYFGVIIPFGEMGNIGVNITALNMDDMQVTTENDPDGTGEFFSAGSYAFGVTYARDITADFSVGVNLKYIREDIYNSNADGFAFDVGTIFKTPFWGIRFASSVTNVGGKMQITGDDLLIRHDPDEQANGNNDAIDGYLKTDEFDLPLRLQIGLAKDFTFLHGQRLTIAVDAVHPSDNKQWMNIGGELALFNEMVFLRGGYKALFLDKSQEGLTLGLGIKYKSFNSIAIGIDYAYQKFEYLDDIHSFGVILNF